MGRDYGLSAVATEDVHVHVVPGDHDTIVAGATSGISAAVIADALSGAAEPTIPPASVQEIIPTPPPE